MENSRNVTCNRCGWVHFTVSPEYIAKWNIQWNELFNTESKEWLATYGVTDKPPSDKMYYRCFLCGGSYDNFRESKEEDLPYGSTTQPILDFKYERTNV